MHYSPLGPQVHTPTPRAAEPSRHRSAHACYDGLVEAAQPPVRYIDFTRRTYSRLGYPAYEWVHSEDPPPFVRPRRPLRDSRLALVASGGIYRAGQIAFHFKDDTSYRRIPTDVAMSELRATHFAYDLSDARRDPNVVFPLGTLRGLVDAGLVGELASHAITFMGGIYSARRVRTELAPAVARSLREMGTELALLVPV